MSSKSDILNRTWTLLPEDENVDVNNDVPMDYDEASYQLFQVADNQSNLLDEEYMSIDITSQSIAKNQTRIIDSPQSLDETKRAINNKTMNLNETVNKSPIALKESLSVNYIYDLNRISIEMENLEKIFNVEERTDSLFDETLTGLDPFYGDPISAPISPKQSRTNLNNLTINLEKTESQNIPKLKKQESIVSPLSSSLSASIDNLDNLHFNPSSVPKSFDLFINDLKKSSSIQSLNSNSQSSLNSNLTKRIITSSIDKDLNKDFRINKIKNLSNLKETDLDLFTSSPLRNKLNRTVDLNTKNSNESLDESEQSLSVSQSSSIANFHLNNEDDPRTVFNTTYTAWATSDQQIQIEALNQQKLMVESNSSIILNQTQDLNNNTSHLNKTKDIIHDSNENLNRTRDLKQPSKVLNTTQDLTTSVSQFKPVQASQLKRISSIQSTRPSSIYQKSNIKPIAAIPTGKIEIKKTAVNTKLAQPVTVQSADFAKPKVIAKSSTVSKSAVSSVKSPIAQTQRPNTLTTQNSNSIKPDLISNSSQAVNLNRLSSTSSSSSTSTSSSSSLKENKKSPTSQIKSPNSKIATLSALNQNTGLSRLKTPSLTTNSIAKPSVIPQSIKTPTEPAQQQIKSMLKPPSQIPTFKIPTGIPTLRNATNQVKVN